MTVQCLHDPLCERVMIAGRQCIARMHIREFRIQCPSLRYELYPDEYWRNMGKDTGFFRCHYCRGSLRLLLH